MLTLKNVKLPKWLTKKRLAAILVVMVVAVMGSAYALSSMAAPDDTSKQAVCDAGFEHMPVVGCAKKQANGHYKVKLKDGQEFETHGPDHEHVEAEGEVNLLAVDPPRQPTCSSDYRQVFLYVHMNGAANNLATARPTIIAAAKRMNGMLNQDAVATGNVSADFKVKCDAAGEVSVQSFSTGAADFTSVSNAAKAAGFTSTMEKYSIFADFSSGSYSGIGGFMTDETLASTNRSNRGPSYAMTMKSSWNGRTPMHENGHNMGAVQANAPDTSGGGHCNDGQDVMCYSDGGSRSAYNANVCTDRAYYDCGHDTYFDARPESGEYLQTRWNIGVNTSWASFSNNFIRFGVPGTPPPATPPPATPPPAGQINQTGNLATGKLFTSSAANNTTEPSNPPANVNDRNEATRWISTPTDNTTLSADLGANYTLSKVSVMWAADTVRSYDLQISSDNSTWRTIASGTTNNTQKQLIDTASFTQTPTGRYFRVLAKDRWVAGYGNSIWEIGVYGTTATTPTPPPPTNPPPPPVAVLGDVNGDTRINALDLSALISHDGQVYAPADFNFDGTVGAADMAILLSKWTW